MSAHTFRPHSPERSWSLGTWVAFATTAVLGVSLALDGTHRGPGWALIAGSTVIAGLAATSRVRQLVSGERGWIVQYVWTAAGILATGALSLLLDVGPLHFIGIYTIALVASAGSYPRRGALSLAALVVVTGVSTWLVASSAAPGITVAVAAALVTVILVGGLGATAALTRALAAAEQEHARAEVRNRLLTVIGRTVTLDIDRVADQVVDGVVELGFEVAALSILEGDERRHVATRNLDASPITPARSGLAGRALTEGRAVWSADYATSADRIHDRPALGTAVAVPVTVGGRPLGTLVGARAERGEPSQDDIAVLEVLAQHAGHALANAYRFREEQAVVDRLRHLDRLKRDLVSNVSHDLRTPLASVRGLAGTLQVRGDRLDPETAAVMLEHIRGNAARLTEMIEGLLDFGGLDVGEEHHLDLAAEVGDCVERLAPVLETHLVSVGVGGGIAVRTHPRLLAHTLENLLGNAVKYTPHGTAVRVAAVVDETTDEVEISVADDGPGIHPDDLPHLTRRFFRGRAGTEQPGTGLGLALVDDMLRGVGSRLHITSEPGHGARFSFRLPRADGVEP